MTDIISSIDQATGCHQCGNPLGSSPSSDFCSEFCQRTWQSNRIGSVAAPPESIPEFVVAETASQRPGPAYQLGGAVWYPGGHSLPAREYRAHYEIRADGSVVDNTAAIRHQNEGCNEDIRGWIPPEAWRRCVGDA